MKNGNLELIKEKDFLNCLLIFKIGGDKVININRKLEYKVKNGKSIKILNKNFNTKNLKSFLLEFNTFINFIPTIDKFYLHFDEDKMIKLLESVKYFSNSNSNSDIDVELENIFNYLLNKFMEV